MGFCLHLFVLLMCAMKLYPAENRVAGKTYNSSTPVFQIQISSSKKTLFVATGNKLIQLNTNLSLDRETNKDTNEGHGDEEHEVTILLSHKLCLLVCSSGIKGKCQLHNEKNISDFIPYPSWSAISHTVGTGKAIAFVSELSKQKLFYVAKSYDGTDLKSFGFMISATKMHIVNHSSCGFNIFTNYVTGLSPHTSYIYSSDIRYIYGFGDENFAYFLLTQRLIEENSYETRLARVCHGDSNYKSYSEIPLICLSTTNQAYNLAITGYLEKRAEYEEGISTEILYAVFGTSRNGQDSEDSFGSVVCTFHLDEVRMAFYNATRDCLEGGHGAKRIKTLLGGDFNCEKENVTSPENIERALCHPGRNYYVEGRNPMVGLTVASLNEVTVSLSITHQHGHTVAFLITKNGFVAKYVVEPREKRGRVYNVLVDDDAQPEIRSSNVLDMNEKYLYLLSRNKVIRFPIGSCFPHPDCMSCLAKTDPLGCGWCSDHCATEEECFLGARTYTCQPVVNQSLQSQAKNVVSEEKLLASLDTAIPSETEFPPGTLWPSKTEPITETLISPEVVPSETETVSRATVVVGTIAVMTLLCVIVFTINKLGFFRYPCWYKTINTFYTTWYIAKDHVQEETLQNVCSQEQNLQNWHENQEVRSWFKTSEETMCLLSDVKLNLKISRDFVTLGDQIGQGHFGRIYEGQLKIPGNAEGLQVAVKTLHNCRNQETGSTESFLHEGLLMKGFHHRNVLTLIGVCFEDTGLPMIILPFMKNGDMKTYIEDEENKPTITDLMDFGVQVAEGMQYLSELKCIHRDLAARNCLLDENLTVKVADFGLTRDHHEYYRSRNNKSKLPIKWMAPESLEKGTFSNKSDVWSFGVLLWELMTRGVTPYPQVGNWEVLDYIKSGRRMFKPLFCPDMLYGIMCRCWNDNPKKRPKFSELAVEITDVIKKMRNRKKNIVLNVTYYNVPNPGEEDRKSTAVRVLTVPK